MDNKLKNKIKHTVRYLAVDILESVENEDAYSNLLLNKVILSEKLSPKDAGLLTEDIDDLVPLVRPPRLEDLVVVADIEDLVDPMPLLDLVIEELLTPALLEEDPIPLLLLEPVVLRRGV